MQRRYSCHARQGRELGIVFIGLTNPPSLEDSPGWLGSLCYGSLVRLNTVNQVHRKHSPSCWRRKLQVRVTRWPRSPSHPRNVAVAVQGPRLLHRASGRASSGTAGRDLTTCVSSDTMTPTPLPGRSHALLEDRKPPASSQSPALRAWSLPIRVGQFRSGQAGEKKSSESACGDGDGEGDANANVTQLRWPCFR
jgi:hypothetical protein